MALALTDSECIARPTVARLQSNEVDNNLKWDERNFRVMKKVGLIGLDTSHAGAFASTLERSEEADVTAVWDGGRVRDPDYVAEFCEEYEATQYGSPADMIDEIDGALVLTVDWDRHCELALPFLEAGVPTLVDKPLAGRLQDVEILEAAANGTPFFGGSAVPFHPALRSFTIGREGRALYCAGYDDTFYYGCHLVDAVRRLAGADWTVVRPAPDPGLTVDVVFENDAYATIRLDGPNGPSNFTFLNVGDESEAAVVGSDEEERHRMYDAYLDAFLRTFDGGHDESRRVFDGAKLLLGVHTALSERQPITATSDRLKQTHIQGESFVESYEPYY